MHRLHLGCRRLLPGQLLQGSGCHPRRELLGKESILLPLHSPPSMGSLAMLMRREVGFSASVCFLIFRTRLGAVFCSLTGLL